MPRIYLYKKYFSFLWNLNISKFWIYLIVWELVLDMNINFVVTFCRIFHIFFLHLLISIFVFYYYQFNREI
jgi:hypothetical protein